MSCGNFEPEPGEPMPELPTITTTTTSYHYHYHYHYQLPLPQIDALKYQRLQEGGTAEHCVECSGYARCQQVTSTSDARIRRIVV